MKLSNTYLFPWHEKSRASRDLSSELGVKRILREGSKFEGSPEKWVINYGNSDVPAEVQKCKIINDPKRVAVCVNKLDFFRAMQSAANVRVPPWTNTLEKAMEWVRAGILVAARTKLTARAGAGLVFIENLKEFVKAPLYTKYIRKKEEYRVHFAFGKRIAIQQKVLRKTDDDGRAIDPATVDFRVRSHKNGFIFQRHNLHTPDDVVTQATRAFNASKLDFGAVDVIWNEHLNKAYVLEINTAPGLEGQTLEDYVHAFKESW